MGNYILKNDKDFFRINNAGLRYLHYKLEEFVENNKVSSEINKNFIEKIDQGNYGCGTIYLELTDFYEHHPEDLKELINLITQILDHAKKNDELTAPFYDAFDKFNADLREYLSTLTK